MRKRLAATGAKLKSIDHKNEEEKTVIDWNYDPAADSATTVIRAAKTDARRLRVVQLQRRPLRLDDTGRRRTRLHAPKDDDEKGTLANGTRRTRVLQMKAPVQ